MRAMLVRNLAESCRAMRQLHRTHRAESIAAAEEVLRTVWNFSKRFAILALALVATAAHNGADRIEAQTKSTPATTQSQSRKPATTPANAPTPAAAPNSPVSTHYPILLLAFGAPEGTQTGWSIRIGIKGPERMDRPELSARHARTHRRPTRRHERLLDLSRERFRHRRRRQRASHTRKLLASQ